MCECCEEAEAGDPTSMHWVAYKRYSNGHLGQNLSARDSVRSEVQNSMGFIESTYGKYTADKYCRQISITHRRMSGAIYPR